MKKIVKELEKSVDNFIEEAEKDKGKENGLILMAVSETGDAYLGTSFGPPDTLMRVILSICRQDEQTKFLFLQAALNMLSIEDLEGVIEEKKKLLKK